MRHITFQNKTEFDSVMQDITSFNGISSLNDVLEEVQNLRDQQISVVLGEQKLQYQFHNLPAH